MAGEPIVEIRDLRKTYVSKERQGLVHSRPKVIEALKGIHLDIF